MGYKSFAVLYPNIPYGVELANEFWDAGGRARRRRCAARRATTHDQTTFTTEAKKLVGRYYLEDRLRLPRGRAARCTEDAQDAFRKPQGDGEAQGRRWSPIVDFEASSSRTTGSGWAWWRPALAVEDIITNACDPRDLERIRKTTGQEGPARR